MKCLLYSSSAKSLALSRIIKLSSNSIIYFSWSPFFSNLFKKKAVYESPEKEDVYQETNIKKVVLERPEVEADMKQMALVTQEILKRLSHEELQEFKNSMEFETYKDILRRYGLVKEEKK